MQTILGSGTVFFFQEYIQTIKKCEKKYKDQCLPTGCIPVPKDGNSKRKINDWAFYYNGWDNRKKKDDIGHTQNDMNTKLP